MQRFVGYVAALLICASLNTLVGLSPELSGAATASTSDWSAMSGSGQIDGRNQTTFPSLSCVSSSFCMAVGLLPTTGGPPMTTEMWNGSSWSDTALPVPAGIVDPEAVPYISLSCLSSSFCLAVGVGDAGDGAFSDEWTGSEWIALPLTFPSGAGLTSVSCLSPNECFGIGYDGELNFAAAWDGSAWSVVPVPGYRDLNDVSCVSATFCMAVGDFEPELWNGSQSSVVQPPSQPADLDSVSCVSAAFCKAVGFGSSGSDSVATPAMASWDGSSWSTDPSPFSPTTNLWLYGVDCSSNASCLAVGTGEFTGNNGVYDPLVAQWTNNSWSMADAPAELSGTYADVPLVVSCVAGWACVTTGLGLTTNTQNLESFFDEAPITSADPPGATITSPSDGSVFALDQVVPTEFDCQVGVAGPGIESCLDSNGTTSPGVIDTSVLGSHTYSVTATSNDGQTATATISYDVVIGAPSATIASPASGDTYALNEMVPTSFSCAEGAGGPGLTSCVDSNGSTSPGTLDTATVGPHTYTVMATSGDGQTGATTISYMVAQVSQTVTTVSPSAYPAVVGWPMYYTANVSPVPDGGTIAFADDGVTIPGCAAVQFNTLNGNGTCPATYETNGPHSITAIYSGDTIFTGSRSAPFRRTGAPNTNDDNAESLDQPDFLGQHRDVWLTGQPNSQWRRC